MRTITFIATAAAACVAAFAAADSWDDTFALVPPNALSVIAIPSPKQASDDMQQCMERTGRPEVGVAGRPIDFLRSQLGIAGGFDDKGTLAVWGLEVDGQTEPFLMIPATDPDALIKGAFTPVPDGGEGAYRSNVSGMVVFVRTVGKHVLIGPSSGSVKAYDPKGGIGPVLKERLGERGMKLACGGDILAWGGGALFKRQAAQLRSLAAKDLTQDLDGGMGQSLGVQMDEAAAAAARERSAAVLEQMADAVLAVDLDAMGVGAKVHVRFEPGSAIAQLMPTTAAGDAAGAASPAGAPSPAGAGSTPQALMSMLPAAPFYVAGGVDVRAMGGMAAVRKATTVLPMGDRLPLPAWLDAVQDKIDGVQLAIYPSKLAIVSGGLINDSAFVVRTKDPAAVKAALKTWVEAQTTEGAGVKVQGAWEESRTVKEGLVASAFSVKETVVDATKAGPMFQRMIKQFVVGARGLLGFAAEVPGGLVITGSQRSDVLERALAAARSTDGANSLGARGVVKAMGPWLIQQPDAVVFVGVGELAAAADQIMQSLPGGGALPLQFEPAAMEPIACAMRSRDGTWQAACMVPSSVIGLGIQAAMLRLMPPPDMGGGMEEEPAPPPRPAPPAKQGTGAQPAPAGTP